MVARPLPSSGWLSVRLSVRPPLCLPHSSSVSKLLRRTSCDLHQKKMKNNNTKTTTTTTTTKTNTTTTNNNNNALGCYMANTTTTTNNNNALGCYIAISEVRISSSKPNNSAAVIVISALISVVVRVPQAYSRNCSQLLICLGSVTTPTPPAVQKCSHSSGSIFRLALY